MAASFFALFDDIATVMDDVALMTKAATKKTAGVLGDDLALNANQVTGVSADRELPVIWAVTKGALVNKAILVPVALLLSAFIPWALSVLLMIGGAYLCYEGVEKVLHVLIHRDAEIERQHQHKVANAHNEDLVNQEKTKIRGAIRTDFILSAEIIVIAMGVLIENDLSLPLQVITLSIIALLITFFIYGTVAIIVKMDDVGLHWVEKYDGLLDAIGRGLLWFAPFLLKILSVVGTLAMFIVGGHIWVEGIGALHHWVEHWAHDLHGVIGWFATTAFDILIGAIVGLVVYAVITPLLKLFNQKHNTVGDSHH